MKTNRERFRERTEYYSRLTTGYIIDFINGRDIPVGLRESMLYSIKGGKRLRPAILMGSAMVFDSSIEPEVLPYAAAMEMIHTYSLIHDDLPAMDDDDMRRGQPANHIEFGEANAILAGDALLNSAAECMLINMDISDDRGLRAAAVILDAAGPGGMIGGQNLDLKGVTTEKELKKMYSLKTGALIKAAATAGSILGGCSSRDEKQINEYAELAGYAFQIKDDILDVSGNEDIIGKPAGSDARNNKITIVSMFGLKRATVLVEKTAQKAIDVLSGINGDTWYLEEIVRFITERKD